MHRSPALQEATAAGAVTARPGPAGEARLPRLGIVCPMANEIATAVRFVDEVVSVCHAERRFSRVTFFAVLDRVSHDGTLAALTRHQQTCPDLQVVWAPENRCVVDAYVRGYREALAQGADWVLEIDGGYSHQPAEIPRFFAKMAEGYDCVYGSRFCHGGAMTHNPLIRKVVSRGGAWASKIALGSRLNDMTSGFQLFSRTAISGILDRGIRSRGPFFQTEMKAYSHRLRVAEVPITYSGGAQSVRSAAITDALAGLWRLFRLKLQGRL